MQKHSIRQRIQRKERWCRKMEKKLAVIVDNKEITTEVTNTEMCSSACDVAMETCSSECHDTHRMCGGNTKETYLEIFYFKQFYKHFVFSEDEEGNRNKRMEKYFEVSAVVDVGCGDTKEFV